MLAILTGHRCAKCDSSLRSQKFFTTADINGRCPYQEATEEMWMVVHTWRLWRAGQSIDLLNPGWLFDAVQELEKVTREYEQKEVEKWRAK